MIPDFLADLEILGVAQPQLDVLMTSAQAYVDVWRKARPTRNFRPNVTSVTYRGISPLPPTGFNVDINCPSTIQDARWWEFEIEATEVSGLPQNARMYMSDFPTREGCILEGTASSPMRVAIPIRDGVWTAYDSDEWEVTIVDPNPADPGAALITRGIQLEIPRPTIELTMIGAPTVENGDCPQFNPEEESGSDRDFISSAIYRPTGKKIRQVLEANVLPHTPDFVVNSYTWSAETPAAGLGTGQSATVEFCPCGSRLVRLEAGEASGIETAEYRFLMDAPELSLTVDQDHIDQFGARIHDPRRSAVSAATVELSVGAAQTQGTPSCDWREVRWRDASPTSGSAADVPVPAGRLVPHGDGCTATLTLWDPAVDGGTTPPARMVRGVVVMEDGLQCGKNLFTVDTTPVQELATHDFRLKPVRPIKMRIGRSGVTTTNVKLKVENVLDPEDFVDPREAPVATLAVTNLDCPEGILASPIAFDRPLSGDEATAILPPGKSAPARLTPEARSEWFETLAPGIPHRCSVEVRVLGPDETDPRPDHSEILATDIFDRTSPHPGRWTGGGRTATQASQGTGPRPGHARNGSSQGDHRKSWQRAHDRSVGTISDRLRDRPRDRALHRRIRSRGRRTGEARHRPRGHCRGLPGSHLGPPRAMSPPSHRHRGCRPRSVQQRDPDLPRRHGAPSEITNAPRASLVDGPRTPGGSDARFLA